MLFGLQQGSQVLKEIHKAMDLDMVEQLMSDTAEGVAYQKVSLRFVVGCGTGTDVGAGVGDQRGSVEQDVGGG